MSIKLINKIKAGLFICDHVDAQHQSAFGDYPDMFAKLFPEFEFKLFDVVNGEFPDDLNECDVYMATGSRYSVYEDLDWINRTKKIIRNIYEQQKIFIGICFGHQLMGEALGGKVEKSPNGWCVGVHEFEIKEQIEWIIPRLNSFNILMMCQDQVIDLPDNARILAGNELCPVGIFQVGDNMLGIQGHPEYSKKYDQLLMEKRMGEIGEKGVEEGIERLNKNVNADIFHDWICNFIASNL